MQWLESFILKKFDLLSFLKIFIILNIIIPSISTSYMCGYYTPFLLHPNETCKTAEDCPSDYIESGKCDISNETVKIQFFNNMISLNYSNATLINFDVLTTLNGNLVFLGSTPDSQFQDKRIFYILNKNGRGYFTNNITNEQKIIYIFEDLSTEKNHGNLFSFKIDNTEYIWNISPNNIIEKYDINLFEKY